jgi:hypothetical protein
VAALTNNGNVVIGDDISRIVNVYQDDLLPVATDDANAGLSLDELASDEQMTSWVHPGKGALTDLNSGYLLYFSYLPSSYATPDYPTFTLLATPGIKLGELGSGSAETWGLIGE